MDWAIWNLVSDEHWRWTDERHEAITTDRFGPDALGNPICDTDDFTTSLDASIALCEQKTETREQFIEVLDKGVDLWIASGDEDYRTMPKYVVIALLRALEDGK